jgi:succinate dehydrogenase hydrophobic anchor subunit
MKTKIKKLIFLLITSTAIYVVFAGIQHVYDDLLKIEAKRNTLDRAFGGGE